MLVQAGIFRPCVSEVESMPSGSAPRLLQLATDLLEDRRTFPDQSVKLRQPLELLTKSVIMRRLELLPRGALCGSRPAIGISW